MTPNGIESFAGLNLKMENNIRTWAKLTAIDETLYFAWWNY